MRKRKLEKIECEICGNKDKEVLHAHHIVERTEKNTNNDPFNLAILCANCHTKIHANLVKIIGIYPSTKQPYGRTLIYEENGEPNVPGITDPYYVPKPKQMKVPFVEDKDE